MKKLDEGKECVKDDDDAWQNSFMWIGHVNFCAHGKDKVYVGDAALIKGYISWCCINWWSIKVSTQESRLFLYVKVSRHDDCPSISATNITKVRVRLQRRTSAITIISSLVVLIYASPSQKKHATVILCFRLVKWYTCLSMHFNVVASTNATLISAINISLYCWQHDAPSSSHVDDITASFVHDNSLWYNVQVNNGSLGTY